MDIYQYEYVKDHIEKVAITINKLTPIIHKKMTQVSQLPVNKSVANLFELIVLPLVKPSTQRIPKLIDIRKRTAVMKRFISLK